MVTREDVQKIAKLARLEIHENELEKFTGQMNNLLDFIAKLNELDTKNIEPTSHAISIETPFREDRVVESHIREKVFKTAPEQEGNLFKVPKVI